MNSTNNNYSSCAVSFLNSQTCRFPLNTFFSLQTFSIYQSATDFLGGMIEFPLALIQV